MKKIYRHKAGEVWRDTEKDLDYIFNEKQGLILIKYQDNFNLWLTELVRNKWDKACIYNNIIDEDPALQELIVDELVNQELI